jgi:hypothetical protein
MKPVLFASKRINIRFIFAYIRFEPHPIPHKLFLKVSWDNKQLASSDFTHGTRKKAAGVKDGK